MIENIQSIENTGYCVIKNFVNEHELDILITNYNSNRVNIVNKNYSVNSVSNETVAILFPKLEQLAKTVSEHTSIKVDMLTDDCAFPDNSKINFGWHQEHESYYKFQQLHNYINLYIPIIKQEATRSGLAVVPADRLKASVPNDQFQIMSRGAAHYSCTENQSILHDDVFDEKFNISVSLDKIKHVPEILPGDLLVLRGTTIHKTQDTDTHRVAVSIRLTSSFDKINKNILLAGGQTKQRYMSNNSKIYQNMHNFFDSKNIEETSAYEMFGEFHNRIKQLSENIN